MDANASVLVNTTILERATTLIMHVDSSLLAILDRATHNDAAARLDRLVSRLLEPARFEDERGVEPPVDLETLPRACAAAPGQGPVKVHTTGNPVILGRQA